MAPALASRLLLGVLHPATGLLGVAGVLCFIAWATEVAMSRSRMREPARTNMRVLVAAISVFLLVLEIVLRMGFLRLGTYIEANGGPYRNPYNAEKRRYHVYPAGLRINAAKREFTHSRTVSELGLTDISPPAVKAADEFRIVALGDSFTEGVGAPADATWVRVMQRTLAEEMGGRRVTALNAGVSGSDPVNEFVLFKDKLVAMEPDLVIVATNASDVNDAIYRGGTERFRADGTVRYRKSPVWEPIYGLSYTARLITHNVLGYNQMLIARSAVPVESARAAQIVRSALQEFQRFCASRGIAFLVVAHPVKFEVVVGSYEPAFGTVVRALERDPGMRVIDLLPEYPRNGINADSVRQFYWDIDLHHNARGYDVMGRAIARGVVAMGLTARSASASN